MKTNQSYQNFRALILSALFVFLHSVLFSQGGQIELVHSDKFTSTSEFNNAVKVIGHVHFRQENRNLYCDSAYFHRTENWIRAFGSVQINQADTLNLFCDSLYFNGITNQGVLMSKVRFRDNEFKMTTDSLDFDANQSVAYYTNWAYITSINQDLNLVSKKGYYYAQSKTFYFKDSVEVTHPNYHLSADTLEYRTTTQTVLFHGPTTVTIDSTIVLCNKGFYDTQSSKLELWQGATIIIDSVNTLYSDSLFYNQLADIAIGYGHVVVTDSIKNIQLKGGYLKKTANNERVTLANNARVYKYSEKDTLYLRADTIYNYKDVSTNQSTSIAVNHVQLIKAGVVGVCDSLYYNEKDSIIKLRKTPLVWKDLTQLSADSIDVTLIDDDLDQMQLYQRAFVATQHDSIHFDQVAGKYITAYFKQSNIKEIHVMDNAQTLYYPIENKKDSLNQEIKTLMGQNRLIASNINLFFKANEVQKIIFIEQVEGQFTPMDQILFKNLYLLHFVWNIDKKPSVKIPQ